MQLSIDYPASLEEKLQIVNAALHELQHHEDGSEVPLPSSSILQCINLYLLKSMAEEYAEKDIEKADDEVTPASNEPHHLDTTLTNASTANSADTGRIEAAAPVHGRQ